MSEREEYLISLLVPVYNEELTVDHFVEEAEAKLSKLKYEIVFINDGSTDSTKSAILDLLDDHHYITLVDLSRNFGKEAAMMAGLNVVKGSAVVPIDVDLQDPLDVIPQMLKKWEEGYEVVLAKRANRNSDTYAKKTTSALFYKIFNSVSDFKIPENVGDFRLIDKSVSDEISKLGEKNLFMKGLFSWVGFKTATINYVREERIAGETKFSFWKLWNFALEGITSFSYAPLRIWTYIGFALFFTSISYVFYLLMNYLLFGIRVEGYLSVIISLFLFSGVQLMGLGLIGEYIGRIYIESKSRPQFIIRKIYNKERQV